MKNAKVNYKLFINKTFMENLNDKLNNFLGKKIVNKTLSDGSIESCDLETGECKIIRHNDGLLERNNTLIKRNVNVETVNGEIKKLLND